MTDNHDEDGIDDPRIREDILASLLKAGGYDPKTAEGLLISVDFDQAEAAWRRFSDNEDANQVLATAVGMEEQAREVGITPPGVSPYVFLTIGPDGKPNSGFPFLSVDGAVIVLASEEQMARYLDGMDITQVTITLRGLAKLSGDQREFDPDAPLSSQILHLTWDITPNGPVPSGMVSIPIIAKPDGDYDFDAEALPFAFYTGDEGFQHPGFFQPIVNSIVKMIGGDAGHLFRVGCGDPNCNHCKTIEGEPIPTVDEVDKMADAAGLRNCQGPDCPTCAMNAQSAAYQQALNANLLYVDEPAPAPPADAIGYLTRYYNDTLVPEARDAGVVNIEPLDGGG